jgi:tetratricopeptide (TPR) repeat protein
MKPVKVLLLSTALICSPLFAAQSGTANFDQSLHHIQKRWAEINYTVNEEQKEKAFERLALEADKFAQANPKRAEPLIWQGIVLSTWAGAKGGLGALSLVKQAKQLLEQSLKIDDGALDGSAYTSLGSLYYQVPGWPIGFGDEDKAQAYLQKAVQINPRGIDANYFYADFLIDQGDYAQARKFLKRAMQAPARPQRPLADRGRRDEIQAKQVQLREQLASRAEQDDFFN